LNAAAVIWYIFLLPQFHSFSHKIDEEKDTKKLRIVLDTQQGLHGSGQATEGGAGQQQCQHRPSLIDLLTGDHGTGKDSTVKTDTTTSSQSAHRGELKSFLKHLKNESFYIYIGNWILFCSIVMQCAY
jgi:hypothetical protein